MILFSHRHVFRCWFAAEDIAKGEKLWWAPEQLHPLEILVTLDEMMAWPVEKRDKFMELAYQINDTTMAGFPDDLSELPAEYVAENFVNHSCDGCGWYEGSDLLVALRDIRKGEEIAYDYALTESAPHFVLQCRCGQKKCRGAVTGNDWKLPELQQLYGNHFLPHILEKIAESKAAK